MAGESRAIEFKFIGKFNLLESSLAKFIGWFTGQIYWKVHWFTNGKALRMGKALTITVAVKIGSHWLISFYEPKMLPQAKKKTNFSWSVYYFS